jgi:hypothetical protein
MPQTPLSTSFPLARGWHHRVRSAVIQVISLARTSLTLTHGWASESLNHALRQQAEEDRLRQETQLLREELDLSVQFLAERRHLPIITLKRVA